MAATVPEKYYHALQEAGVSVEEATRYYTSFKIYDKDGSDSIDSGELFSCLQVLGQAPKSKDEVEKLMKEHDKDHSGSLDFLEFAKLMAHVCKPTHAVRDDLVMSFQVFDKDHSGYLDRKELHDAIFALGKVNLSEKEFDHLMKIADTNGDGKIDYAEFTAILMTDVTKLIESSKKKLEDKEHGGYKGGKDHKEKSKDHGDHKEKDHHGGDHKDKDHHGGEHKDKDHHGGEHKDKDHKDKDHHGEKHKDKDHHGEKLKDKDHHGEKHKDKDHHGGGSSHKKRKHSGVSSHSGRSSNNSFSVKIGGFKFHGDRRSSFGSNKS